MKNHADAMIFHTANLRRSRKLAIIAEEKSPSRIFLRVSSQKTLRHGGLV